ncbi:MAG: hypothetical protein AAGI53_09590 [Planctomycetota bacterium]
MPRELSGEGPGAPVGEATPASAARTAFLSLVEAELDRAYAKHGRDPWGRHEFFAILKEELDEAWDEIRADSPSEALFAEVVQVVAVCLRYVETGDRYRGGHPDSLFAGAST